MANKRGRYHNLEFVGKYWSEADEPMLSRAPIRRDEPTHISSAMDPQVVNVRGLTLGVSTCRSFQGWARELSGEPASGVW